MNVDTINSFRGEYAFLSNFYQGPFIWRNIYFLTVEHAFQAAKSLQDADYVEQIRENDDPRHAKRLGRKVEIDVKEWDNNKVGYMREIIHAKFSQVQGLAGKLINTGGAMLVEGNDWGDEFWGRAKQADGRYRGRNILGAILMEERGYWLWGNEPPF